MFPCVEDALSEVSDISAETIDHHYLELCQRILRKGKLRENRTGISTISRFGERLDIDLKLGFPLLTTKKVFWKGVVGELLWFISGSINAKKLAQKGIHIWDGNSSREYLDSRGLTAYPEGIIGPGYGWQWRNFGASLEQWISNHDPGSQAVYEHWGRLRAEGEPSRDRRGGVDQLAEVIQKIRTNPTDRRLIVTAWNPTDLPAMALPPCHILYQFYVEDGELSCQMYQRSVDVGLGLPFNIASYALLTHIVAHITKLRVGRLIMCLGDTHIYTSHIAGIKEQLSRKPKTLPRLEIKEGIKDIDSITEEDIRLIDYIPHPPLSHTMTMAV